MSADVGLPHDPDDRPTAVPPLRIVEGPDPEGARWDAVLTLLLEAGARPEPEEAANTDELS